MKKEAAYIIWNLFLFGSLLTSYFTGVNFPYMIVGVLAGIELAVWFLVLACIGIKDVQEAINKCKMIRGWRIGFETFMCISAFYMGFVKIGCAWVMIALLAFAISSMASKVSK